VVLFLQAEDGIRDATVTGVQTCALPILAGMGSSKKPKSSTFSRAVLTAFETSFLPAPNRRPLHKIFQNTTVRDKLVRLPGAHGRSEERRVGTEWRHQAVGG